MVPSRNEIVFRRGHAAGIEGALAGLRRIADELAADYQCECRWSAGELHFSRTGVVGRLGATGSEVDLYLKLGFLLTGFKPRIEASLGANFDRYFGPARA